MRMTRHRTLSSTLVVLLLVALGTAGCSSHRVFRDAEIAAQTGDWDEAVLKYMEAVAEEPSLATKVSRNPFFQASETVDTRVSISLRMSATYRA